MHLSYSVLSIAVPALVAFITTILVIRFGPNRQEVSRLAKLVQGIVDQKEKDKKLEHFRCDVSFENLFAEGSRARFSATSPFRLTQLTVANGNRTPFRTIAVNSRLDTVQTCVIPHEAINCVYWSTAGAMTKDGVLLFTVDVDGVTLDREQGVALLLLNYNLPNDATIRSYVRMS